MTAFKQVVEDVFVRRMVNHLRSFFPTETRDQNDALLDQFVRNELKAAAHFQLVYSRDLTHYLNLAIVYGPGFIDRAENVWMKDYLTDPEVSDISERMSRLYVEAVRRWELEAENRAALERFNRQEGQ